MELKRSYIEDIRVLRDTSERVWFAVLVASLLSFPILAVVTGRTYLLFRACLAGVYVIAAIGLNLLVGYTGQISLGHAGFLAIGAYATGLLQLNLAAPFLLALPAGGLVAAVFGFLVGLPALRMTGPYLAIATVGFGVAVQQVLVKWESLSGGSLGIHPPRPAIAGWIFDSEVRLYYLIMTIAVLLTLAAVNLVRSRVGRAFVAIRDSDIAAEAMGVNLALYKTLAFAVSAFYAGIAGGLLAGLIGFISPESFNIIESINYLTMVVVGGLGSILGSVLGALLISVLQHLLSGVKSLPQVVYGLILVLVVIFEPLGLRGRWLKTKFYWRAFPF
jgi:branched-chain amino acid transport system permease protein